MAIASIYRHDYARAGYLVLPEGEQSAYFMSCTTVAASAVLIPLTIVDDRCGEGLSCGSPADSRQLPGERRIFLLQCEIGAGAFD